MTDIPAEIAALVPRLRRFAWGLCGSRDDGDDLVQSACAKALSRLDQYMPGTRLDSWMFTIIRTQWIDTTRKRRRMAPSLDAEEVAAISDQGRGAREAEDRLLLAQVRQAVSELPEEQRAIVLLVCLEGKSYRETSETLGIPIGTVMSRLARARAALQARIGEI